VEGSCLEASDLHSHGTAAYETAEETVYRHLDAINAAAAGVGGLWTALRSCDLALLLVLCAERPFCPLHRLQLFLLTPFFKLRVTHRPSVVLHVGKSSHG